MENKRRKNKEFEENQQPEYYNYDNNQNYDNYQQQYYPYNSNYQNYKYYDYDKPYPRDQRQSYEAPYLAEQQFTNNTFEPSSESDETKQGKRRCGRKKIKMEYIHGKNKRSVTFSKRKKGIMKKAYELNVLTGTQILLLVASESGHVYTFATPKLKPIISKHENLIQQCLNTPTNNKTDITGYYNRNEEYDINNEERNYKDRDTKYSNENYNNYEQRGSGYGEE